MEFNQQNENHLLKMKMNLNLRVPVLALAVALTTLNYGCGNKSAAPNNPGATVPTVVPVEKTSFNEVTSQLDPGGNFYLYLGTAQWLDGLSTKVAHWRETFAAMPNLTAGQGDKVNKAFDVVTRLIKDSGIEDVTGVGLSSVEFEKGMYRNKTLLHHYAGKGDGFLWKLGGQEPHPLTGLDFLPANTALAVFADLDVHLLWTTADKEIADSGLPQAQAWLEKLPAQFEQRTQVKWDAFLGSLGGEFGLVVTLDQSNSIPIPLPGGAMTVPTPGLLLAVKVNDDTIFNRIDQQLKSNQQVVSVDQSGLKMRTLVFPLPFIGELRPSAASAGGYLFIASSDGLINESLAVKSGKTPGLKSTDEFKHLSQGLPEQGNSFAYMSRRFAETLTQVQQQAMAANTKANSEMTQWLQSFVRQRPAFAYTVGVNTPAGFLSVGNGSQSCANVVLLPGVAVAGALAAIAVPNFVKARQTSQRNACINNLRQLDAAKNQWALEKGKSPTDVPTMNDLTPYLRSVPHCPAGGSYTLNAVNTPPTCSIPGHQLP